MMKRTGRVYSFPDGEQFPIREADIGTRIVVTARDVNKGEPGNPHGCPIACSAKRNGASHAAISATVAYIVTRIRKKVFAIRYLVPMHTRRAIIRFDRTGKLPQEGFEFAAVTESHSYEAKVKQNHKHYDTYIRGVGEKEYNRKRRANTGKRYKRITIRHLSGHISKEA